MKVEYKVFFLVLVLFFTLFYPMLISIYVFLPLFIGAASYLLVEGIEKVKAKFIIFTLMYLINIEVNLSLPLFLSVISAFVFYITLYPYLKHFRHCEICKAIISVVALDVYYLAVLFAFDFIFQTKSIVLDIILLYSLVIDMLIAVLL